MNTEKNEDLDPRLQNIVDEGNVALNNVDTVYDAQIDAASGMFDKQIEDTKAWGETQKANQQAQTDLTLQQIGQQREQAQKDYAKEQSGAYTDWQKQSNKYGVNAEQMASMGMSNTGYSESAQVAMYNQYQNRVAVAKESLSKANLEFDNMMNQARLQNSVALADIAFKTLQETSELSLQGFLFKNSLILEKENQKQKISDSYHNRYMDILNQINKEAAMEEERRQFDILHPSTDDLTIKPDDTTKDEIIAPLTPENPTGTLGNPLDIPSVNLPESTGKDLPLVLPTPEYSVSGALNTIGGNKKEKNTVEFKPNVAGVAVPVPSGPPKTPNTTTSNINTSNTTTSEKTTPALMSTDWVLKSSGGINWGGGVNGNAKFTNPSTGKTYTANQLVKQLILSGVSKKDAEEYVIALTEALTSKN